MMKQLKRQKMLSPSLITKSPEEQYIELENLAEISQLAGDRADWFKMVFFDENELDIWVERHKNKTIRSLAIQFHMSRFNIRKKISHVDKKLKILRKFFQI